MLQSWNKFCFTNGYIEVSLSLPGPDENTAGYVRNASIFYSLSCLPLVSGLVFGRWVIWADLVMVRQRMGLGRTRTTAVMSAPSRIKPMRTSLGLRLQWIRPQVRLHTTTNCPGFRDNELRKAIMSYFFHKTKLRHVIELVHAKAKIIPGHPTAKVCFRFRGVQ